MIAPLTHPMAPATRWFPPLLPGGAHSAGAVTQGAVRYGGMAERFQREMLRSVFAFVIYLAHAAERRDAESREHGLTRLSIKTR